MTLIQLVEVLIVVGVLFWMVNRFFPMAGSVKSILNAVGGYRARGVDHEGRRALRFLGEDPRRVRLGHAVTEE